jgi:hypothetical protein
MNPLRTAPALGWTVASMLAASSASFAADAAPAAVPPEASIAFARKNIWNWQADGDRGIWVQSLDHQWYYGAFLAPCIDLPFRQGVGFRFGPSGELDKFGAVVVRHYPECVFKSFTRSDGPPHAKKAKPSAGAPVAPAPTAAAPSGPAT